MSEAHRCAEQHDVGLGDFRADSWPFIAVVHIGFDSKSDIEVDTAHGLALRAPSLLSVSNRWFKIDSPQQGLPESLCTFCVTLCDRRLQGVSPRTEQEGRHLSESIKLRPSAAPGWRLELSGAFRGIPLAMAEPNDPHNLDDVMTPIESVHPDHHEHAKSPKHLDDDELARRTQSERRVGRRHVTVR
jgi:hypothetical protein